MRIDCLCIGFFLALLFLFSCQDSPSSLPDLEVSENQRYMQDENGDPFFWLGDTGWLLFSKLSREEAEKYLANRAGKGFNVIQVMALHNLRTRNFYGDSALVSFDVSQPYITPGNSSENPEEYDYWDHVDFIIDLAAKKGWDVTGTEIYPTGTSDFSMGLLKAKKTNSDVLSIWMDMPESAILLKQWFDMKIPALPFGSTLAAAEQPGFWDATDGKGEYTLCNVVNAGNAPSNATPWTMKFYDAYTKRWGIEPEGLGTSSSYMAVYTLKAAIERAGSLKSDKVVTELEKTDIMGVYGRLRFDQKSHQVIPSTDPKEGAVGSILQWQKGKRVVVYPKSIAMGEIKLPPWMGK